jgi:pimeloyl-ACP methyl ester carboxylesterase
MKLGDGRELAYTELGEPGGSCVFFFHGAPMSRLHLVPLEALFAARGLRVISPDRPGYGMSSPTPGRSVADWPADVARLADALGIDSFLVAGHSSGGAYAVACAAMLNERVLGGAVLGGVTDMAWPDAWLGYLEGRFEIELMRLPDEATTISRCADRFGADGRGFLADSFELPAPDVAYLSDESVELPFTAAVLEAFRQGIVGYAQDVHLEGRGWPFDVRRIAAPIEVIHGELDTLVPLAHSRHTSQVIPNANLRVLPGHGHLTTVLELPAIAAALLSNPAS